LKILLYCEGKGTRPARKIRSHTQKEGPRAKNARNEDGSKTMVKTGWGRGPNSRDLEKSSQKCWKGQSIKSRKGIFGGGRGVKKLSKSTTSEFQDGPREGKKRRGGKWGEPAVRHAKEVLKWNRRKKKGVPAEGPESIDDQRAVLSEKLKGEVIKIKTKLQKSEGSAFCPVKKEEAGLGYSERGGAQRNMIRWCMET